MHLCETKQSLEILLLAPIVSLKMPTQPVIACSIAGSKRSFFFYRSCMRKSTKK